MSRIERSAGMQKATSKAPNPVAQPAGLGLHALRCIFMCLDCKSLLRASAVSKAWQAAAEDGGVWEEQLRREFHQPPPVPTGSSAKALFMAFKDTPAGGHQARLARMHSLLPAVERWTWGIEGPEVVSTSVSIEAQSVRVHFDLPPTMLQFGFIRPWMQLRLLNGKLVHLLTASTEEVVTLVDDSRHKENKGIAMYAWDAAQHRCASSGDTTAAPPAAAPDSKKLKQQQCGPDLKLVVYIHYEKLFEALARWQSTAVLPQVVPLREKPAQALWDQVFDKQAPMPVLHLVIDFRRLPRLPLSEQASGSSSSNGGMMQLGSTQAGLTLRGRTDEMVVFSNEPGAGSSQRRHEAASNWVQPLQAALAAGDEVAADFALLDSTGMLLAGRAGVKLFPDEAGGVVAAAGASGSRHIMHFMVQFEYPEDYEILDHDYLHDTSTDRVTLSMSLPDGHFKLEVDWNALTWLVGIYPHKKWYDEETDSWNVLHAGI